MAVKKIKRHFIPNFEACSIVLVAGFVLTSAAAVRAQTEAPDAASRNSPASQMAPAPSAAAVPSNKMTAQEVDKAFTQADTNRDGKLTRHEAARMPAVIQRFDSIDTDKDSLLSREEFDKAVNS